MPEPQQQPQRYYGEHPALMSTCPACNGYDPARVPACAVCAGRGWIPRAQAEAMRRAAAEAGPLPAEVPGTWRRE